jgi:hypothetical protein
MSPEVFEWDCDSVSVDGSGRKNVMYNKGADMWSFGVILWQMFSCETPYLEFKGQSMFAIFNAIKKGHKPNMEDGAFPPRLKVAILFSFPCEKRMWIFAHACVLCFVQST